MTQDRVQRTYRSQCYPKEGRSNPPPFLRLVRPQTGSWNGLPQQQQDACFEARCSCAHGDTTISSGNGCMTQPGAGVSHFIQLFLLICQHFCPWYFVCLFVSVVFLTFFDYPPWLRHSACTGSLEMKPLSPPSVSTYSWVVHTLGLSIFSYQLRG